MTEDTLNEFGYELKDWLARIITSQSAIERFTTIRTIEKEIIVNDKPIILKLEWSPIDDENLAVI